MVFVLFSIVSITSLISVGSAWPVDLVTVGLFPSPHTPVGRLRLLLYTKPILRKNPTVLQCTFPHFAFISLQERTMEQRGKRPV